MFEIGNVPIRCASAVISSLSIPTSGLSTSIVVALRNGREILERLRRHLADHLAGHERARAPLLRQPLGDAQHQAAIDDDAQLGRHGEQHLLLQLAEGDEQQPRAKLIPVSSAAISRTFSCDARERIG